MKTLVLLVLSTIVLFALTPKADEKVELKGVLDIRIKHTDRMEKRIAKIQLELDKKAAERLEKEKIREAKLAKRDKDLQAKADARDKAAK
ncbi:MAG: hypothetical protein Q9M32_09140 [Sulfurimonas sp.]|nr:hypothetical protein [Sulfurimonas sp.]MDQ7059846.1 hypothetical protein [Sulfurimonas sp.]